jgi:hypothetical protein
MVNAPTSRRRFASMDYQPTAKKLKSRIFDRDEVMHQSKGKATIFREKTNWVLLLFRSPVVFILDQSTSTIFGICFFLYTLSFVVFSPFYYYFSDRCGLEIDSYSDAFYLSLETIITIGYGVPDQYFNECPEGIVLLIVQSVVGRILDALLMGVCIIRLARGSRRVCSTIFTDKAYMNFKQGKLFLSFQVAEMREDVPFEAHIRVYAIRHVDHPVRTIYYQTSPMRLLHPDGKYECEMVRVTIGFAVAAPAVTIGVQPVCAITSHFKHSHHSPSSRLQTISPACSSCTSLATCFTR